MESLLIGGDSEPGFRVRGFPVDIPFRRRRLYYSARPDIHITDDAKPPQSLLRRAFGVADFIGSRGRTLRVSARRTT